MIVLFAALVGAVFAAHTVPFPFLLEKLVGSRSMWRVPALPGPPRVYLTFDDGPNPAATPALLDVLARERVRATFFLIDKHVTAETAPLLRRMFAEGHGVALHSDTRALTAMRPERLAETLTAFADRIEQHGGSRPCRAFRPHAGWRSRTMYAGLRRIDHTLVGWGAGLWDWDWFRRPAADRAVPRLLNRITGGSIVVLHDGHHVNPRADRGYTVETVARLVPALKAKGFEFGSVCDVLD
jgi:chitooligosaccharide deacetylase